MRAIQLIAFDNNKNPYIPNEALSVLKSLNTNNLHVISVAGKYRTGKSYILNRVLLNKNQGFNVGHTINACTKGLWMWPELIKLNEKDCLIIDTEGLGSLQEGESTDLKIFLLALLFSSQLIYNSIGNIDEQAIQSLSLVIQLASALQRQDKYDTQELVNTFPAFMWLLRDFSLKLQNQKGVTITPQEYLQQALKHQARTSQAAERKNQIRKQLRTFFQERDCFALVRPTQEERDLQNLSSVEDSKLRPQFVNLIGGLKKRLSESVKPKRVRGRVLSMNGFIELCQYYTKALVDGKLPTISSHWDNLCLSQTHRIFQKFQLEHLKALQSLQNNLPQMTNIHKQIVKQGLEAIDKSFLGKLQKQLFKERFQRKLQSQLLQIKSRINCKKTIQVKLMLEHIEEQTSSDPILKYQAVIMKMSQISEVSTKDQSLYCEFYLYLCEFARNLLQECTNKQFQTEQINNYKIAILEQHISTQKKNQQLERQEYEQEILQLKKKLHQYQYYNSKQQSQKQQKNHKQLQSYRAQARHFTLKIRQLSEKIEYYEGEQIKWKQLESIHNKRIADLQQSIFLKQKQILQKDSLLNLQTIKYRKMIRQKQIIKQRYEQNLDQHLNMKKTIDRLELDLIQLQNIKYSEAGFHSYFQELKRNLRSSQEERKNLSRLLQNQKITFQTLALSPQNLNYNALKRNFELERQQRIKAEDKLNQLSIIMDNCSYFICRKCQFDVSLSCAKQHFKKCSQLSFQCDVSYCYNARNEIQFEIFISRSLKEWTVRHTLSDIRQLLYAFNQETLLELFQQNEDDCDRNQQMRIELNNLLEKYRNRLAESASLREFLLIPMDVNQ